MNAEVSYRLGRRRLQVGLEATRRAVAGLVVPLLLCGGCGNGSTARAPERGTAPAAPVFAIGALNETVAARRTQPHIQPPVVAAHPDVAAVVERSAVVQTPVGPTRASTPPAAAGPAPSSRPLAAEPSEAEMKTAAQALLDARMAQIRERVDRCEAMDDEADPIVKMSCLLYRVPGLEQSAKIETLEKLGCEKASGQPGYVCDYRVSLSSTSPQLGSLLHVFGQGNVDQGRFIRQRGTWLMISMESQSPEERVRTTATAALWVLAQALVLHSQLSAEPADRGVRPLSWRDPASHEIGWYRGSYALLIGNSSYAHGWPRLESIPRELAAVKAVLTEQGFVVEEVKNVDGDRLRSAFKSFIDRHGYERDNRLLFYFAGHGFSRDGGAKAYLVPVDAPQPRADEQGFLARALTMTQILAWAREMEAKHALFLFDSCFSGAIFKSRAELLPPPHIAANVMRPVRQFITAGSAAEQVPDRSVFNPLLVRALRGAGDLNKDNYVTGTELGMYLHDEILAQRVGQTPQFGKIRDPELDEGDFVFAVNRQAGTSSEGTVPAGEAPPQTSDEPTVPPRSPAQEDPFAACTSEPSNFDDGSFPLQGFHDRGVHIGDRGMTAGEFKLSMALPRNLHKACVACYGLARAYRVVSKVRSESPAGSRGLYLLDEDEHWYSVELSGNGNVAIKRYECLALGCATVLWEGSYPARAVDQLSVEVLDGWIRATVNGTTLPRQPIAQPAPSTLPLATGFIVTTGNQPPSEAYFDDHVLTICRP